MSDFTRQQLVDAFQRADTAGDTEAATHLAGMIKSYQDPAAVVPSAPTEYRGTILPFKTTTDTSGNKTREWAVPGAIKDVYDTMVHGGEAALGKREMTPEIGLNSALLGIGGGRAASVTKAGAEKAATTAIDMAKETPGALADTAGAVKKALTPSEVIEPTSQGLRNVAKTHYDVVDNSGVRVSPESFQDFADKLPSELDAYSQRVPGLTPKSAEVVKAFQSFSNEEDALKFGEFERLRQTIGKAAANTSDRHDALVLGEIADKMDGYIDNLTPDHLDVGEQSDLDAVRDNVTKARELWKTNAKMSRIEDIRDIAKNQDDPDLYIRQRARAITRNDKIFSQYTPEQRKIIVKLSKQGTLGQLGRIAPHFTPAGMVKAAIYGAAGAGPIGTAAAATIAGGSTAAFHAAKALRQSRIRDLLNNIAEPVTDYLKKPADRAATMGGIRPPEE